MKIKTQVQGYGHQLLLWANQVAWSIAFNDRDDALSAISQCRINLDALEKHFRKTESMEET